MNRAKLPFFLALGACAAALSTCGQEPPVTVPPDASAPADAATGPACTYPADCALGDCINGHCVECVTGSCTGGTVCSVERRCVRADAGGANPVDGSVVPAGDTGAPECADRSGCAAGLVCKDGKCQGCVSGLECAANENCIGSKCVATSEPDGGAGGPDAATTQQPDAGVLPGQDAGSQAGADSGTVEPDDAGNGCDPSCQNCVYGYCLDSPDGGSSCQCDAGTCILGYCIGGGTSGDGGSSCQPECLEGEACVLGRCVQTCADAGCAQGSCVYGYCVGGSGDGGSGCTDCLPGQTCIPVVNICWGTPLDAGN